MKSIETESGRTEGELKGWMIYVKNEWKTFFRTTNFICIEICHVHQKRTDRKKKATFRAIIGKFIFDKNHQSATRML